MIPKHATLQWSETEPATKVASGEQLEHLLDKLTETGRPNFPISVRLQVHSCEVDILLGLPESFVYVTEVAESRYYITVGDLYFHGIVSFHLLGPAPH